MCMFSRFPNVYIVRHDKTYASQEPTLPRTLESARATEQKPELVSAAPVSRIPNSPVLKDYIIVGQLGRGRSVWLAEETASGLGGRVVVRVGRSDAPAGPLLREIESLARVKSDHVASYRHCLLAADGARAVVFEYVEGEQLSKILARQADGRLPWRAPQPAGGERGGSSSEISVSGVIMGVLRGLAALHMADAPIVHGGLTPTNILVRNGRAVLTDLRKSALSGRSSSAGDDPWPSAHAEEAGRYLSPEQVQPEKAVASEGIDARVDVWAAGVVLHEMLTGHPLFQVWPMLLNASEYTDLDVNSYFMQVSFSVGLYPHDIQAMKCFQSVACVLIPERMLLRISNMVLSSRMQQIFCKRSAATPSCHPWPAKRRCQVSTRSSSACSSQIGRRASKMLPRRPRRLNGLRGSRTLTSAAPCWSSGWCLRCGRCSCGTGRRSLDPRGMTPRSAVRDTWRRR
jgi:serine/threonine protein kinase